MLDIDKLIAETNRQVNRRQQIHPDDPLIVSVYLNQQILQAQVDSINSAAKQTLQETIAPFRSEFEHLVVESKQSMRASLLEGQREALAEWKSLIAQIRAEASDAVEKIRAAKSGAEMQHPLWLRVFRIVTLPSNLAIMAGVGFVSFPIGAICALALLQFTAPQLLAGPSHSSPSANTNQHQQRHRHRHTSKSP